MHFRGFRFLFVLITALVMLGLVGCQAAPAQPTLSPTIDLNKPAPDAAAPAATAPGAAPTVLPGGYPAPGQEVPSNAADPGAGYPVEGLPTVSAQNPAYPAPDAPPSGAPAVENRAKVTGTLLDKAPDAVDPALTRLRVNVQTVEDVAGMPNMAREMANTETDLYVETSRLPELNPNDRFEAVVAFVGDEHGGRFVVQEIEKLE